MSVEYKPYEAYHLVYGEPQDEAILTYGKSFAHGELDFALLKEGHEFVIMKRKWGRNSPDLLILKWPRYRGLLVHRAMEGK